MFQAAPSGDCKWIDIYDDCMPEIRLQLDTDDVPWDQDHAEHLADRIVVALNREFYY